MTMEGADSIEWARRSGPQLAPISSAGESADQDAVRTMALEIVQEIVPWQGDNIQEEEEEYDIN